MPWKTFLQAHGEGLTACDRFTVEVLTLAGLQRYLVFFVIALQSRRVTLAGIHPQPYGTWMEQMARNLTDPVDGCLRRARYLIHDRDPLSTRVFGEILKRFSNRPCTTWGGRGTSAHTDAGGPMRAYSMDLRERALLDSDAGMKAADVAAKYRVSGSWVRLLETAAARNGRGGASRPATWTALHA